MGPEPNLAVLKPVVSWGLVQNTNRWGKVPMTSGGGFYPSEDHRGSLRGRAAPAMPSPAVCLGRPVRASGAPSLV